MQITSRSSRRGFVIGGAAAAASLGPMAIAKLGKPSSSGTLPLVGKAPPSEVAEWESLAGARFLLAGTAVAKLVAVERPAPDPRRPAELARFQPFTVWFETDARLAPAGQQTYRVGHPTRGSIDLFLGRGEDRQGKAVLYALFN
ncbi:hypothetical protein MZO42_09450 [Sphingomonas psychrotolerans]|uniref:DUF6916 domain-containing protein n=1 Tax=Sphingomonas psychrotolerans TaxID=1327635 RepID=A0ABU3N2Z9_9SPHN|nr:hypothetical protein [Sphingomonas psychrotolerans]MDT8758920.1 hypothetical protein [Sphingomonas psychrotolerans]